MRFWDNCILEFFFIFPNVWDFSPNSACTWGSNGVGRGAVEGSRRPSRCRGPFSIVKIDTLWHLPSKTHSKIDKIKELLHLAWEMFNFLGSSLASGLAWPQDGLGHGGPRLKWTKGRSGSKNDEKVKVLRMEFSIVENLSGLQESIFNLSRGPQLHFGAKSKIGRILLDLSIFPLSPCLGSLGLLLFQSAW